MPNKSTLTVVVPICSEENVIPEFYDRLKAVLMRLEEGLDHEIMFVDDGSRDQSLPLLKNLAERDERTRVISFSRNFGHQFAITAGLDHASGDAAVIIDGDLQDPPEIIPEMLEKWREGYKVIYGVREKRKGENPLKLMTARLFYRIIRLLSDTDLPLDAGDFRLLDRKVIDVLKSIREENRYLRGLVSWAGFSHFGLPYKRDPRYAGKTKFTFRKMIKFAFDGILSFSDRPLKISAYLGFLITLATFLMAVKITVGKVLHPQVLVSGWTSLILAVLFMGGIQLISLGILGLYIGRQYREVKRRPLYIISEKTGFGLQEKEPAAHGKDDASC